MLHKEDKKKVEQIQMIALDQLVPADHLLRKIDRYVDFDFIYDLVEDLYCPDNGRPSIDPVVLIKLVFLQHLYGIRSMRQTFHHLWAKLPSAFSRYRPIRVHLYQHPSTSHGPRLRRHTPPIRRCHPRQSPCQSPQKQKSRGEKTRAKLPTTA